MVAWTSTAAGGPAVDRNIMPRCTRPNGHDDLGFLQAIARSGARFREYVQHAVNSAPNRRVPWDYRRTRQSCIAVSAGRAGCQPGKKLPHGPRFGSAFGLGAG